MSLWTKIKYRIVSKILVGRLYDLRRFLYKRTTCPQRMKSNLFKRIKDLDWWQVLPNDDRCCSFCGSISFEQFERLIELSISDPSKCRIELSTKGYKFYVRRPEIKNAMEGGIKFYSWHVPGLHEQHEAVFMHRLNLALKKSLECMIGKQPYEHILVKSINNDIS